jgi:hypothetical protein
MEPTVETVERGGDRPALQVYPAPPDAPTLAVLWPAMGVPARCCSRSFRAPR